MHEDYFLYVFCSLDLEFQREPGISLFPMVTCRAVSQHLSRLLLLLWLPCPEPEFLPETEVTGVADTLVL